MEALFHLAFTFFKIAILASIYGTLIWTILFTFGIFKGKKARTYILSWFGLGAVISLCLWVWFFSYWGNHGLGDHSRIPIGHGQTVEQIDLSSYIAPPGHKYEMYSIRAVAIKNEYCVGQRDQITEEYFVWNLKTQEFQTFSNYTEYEAVAAQKQLPISKEFNTFEQQYSLYWNTWRFFLLP